MFEAGHEFTYPTHCWDDDSKFRYTGHIRVGSFLAVAGFRWRLDPGLGQEFSGGVTIPLDL